MQHSKEKSPKSYGVAIMLCGIFGIMGIHHFYLGDWLHGLADMGLLVLAILFAAQGLPGLATLLIALDALHMTIIFYYLIIEKWRDGQGRPILMDART